MSLRTRLAAVFSTTPKEPPVLHGTVAYHRAYILLDAPSPPSSTEFKARFSTPLQRALQLHATKWGGIVNFAWTRARAAGGAEITLDGSGSESESLRSHEASVTAFSALGGHIHLPDLTLSNVEAFAERLQQHASTHATSAPSSSNSDKLHIYVCTHGTRDCRCGDTGGAVARALREELDRRARVDPSGPASRVVLGEVGHVGGHQFAANMLVYPQGDWLGQLTPDDVPGVLDTILSAERRPLGARDPPLCRPFWRGRMGLDKMEQMKLYATHSP